MKNMKIKILMFGALVISLSSCLKTAVMNTDPAFASNVIELANTGDNYTTSGIAGFYSDLGSVKVGGSKSFNVNVHYTGPGVAPEDITVTLAPDQASLDAYNTKNGTTKVIPPSTVYSFPTSVVIAKGTSQTTVQATVTVTAAFDFSKAYALPIKITKASTGTISGNFGVAVYSFGVRNEYDGIYAYKGYALRAGDAVLSGNFSGKKMTLLTVGATSLQFASYALWGDGASGIGIGYPIMDLNTAGGGSSYPVTLSSSGGLTNAVGYNSRYDVASKTFYISGFWGAGQAARLLTDTLTYIGPR